MANATNARKAQKDGEDLISMAKDAVSRPAEEIINSLRDYAKENPESAALWCFGIGFVLGWRLKPW